MICAKNQADGRPGKEATIKASQYESKGFYINYQSGLERNCLWRERVSRERGSAE